ncbi:MAG: GNAT family N-acetyltransferase [Rhodothermales bacterium]
MGKIQFSRVKTHTKQIIQIQVIQQEDLGSVANIHRSAFIDSALSKLGKEAVRRYYLWQLVGPHDCTALGAFAQGEMVGYCFGGVFRGSLSGFVRSNRFYLIQRVVFRPWLLFNPIFRDRLSNGIRILIKSLLRRHAMISAPSASKKSMETSRFGILSIAVDPRWQKNGIGHILMQAAETQAREGGCTTLHLTVNPKNATAIRFYERSGWKKVIEQDGWTGSMEKSLQVGM